MISVLAGSMLPVVATVDPQTVANSEKFSDVVDMSKFNQVVGVALTGDMASETIDFKCYYCDSDGNNATALKTATQLAAHASNNDNSQLVIAVRSDELNAVAESKRYVKFGLVTGGATGGPCAVVVLGVDQRFGVAADLDLATVKQIKE